MRFLYHGKRFRLFWRGNYSLLEINVGTWGKELVIHLGNKDCVVKAYLNVWSRASGMREMVIV